MISPADAYCIASQWGSYMTASDPGAVFYTFPVADARPQDEEHRADLLAYAGKCLLVAEERAAHPAADEEADEDVENLRDLILFFKGSALKT